MIRNAFPQGFLKRHGQLLVQPASTLWVLALLILSSWRHAPSPGTFWDEQVPPQLSFSQKLMAGLAAARAMPAARARSLMVGCIVVESWDWLAGLC